MKLIWNIIKWIIISFWVVIAIGTTILLISYNDFSVSQIGSKSIFVVDSDRLEPDFKKNDILIVDKASEGNYKKEIKYSSIFLMQEILYLSIIIQLLK